MKVKQPSWEEIVMICQEKMRKRYDEYGNNWTEENSKDSIKFWVSQLNSELNKLIDSLKLQNPKQTIANSTDLLNVCAMIMTLEMYKLD